LGPRQTGSKAAAEADSPADCAAFPISKSTVFPISHHQATPRTTAWAPRSSTS
jgi:hypothetical protein